MIEIHEAYVNDLIKALLELEKATTPFNEDQLAMAHAAIRNMRALTKKALKALESMVTEDYFIAVCEMYNET